MKALTIVYLEIPIKHDRPNPNSNDPIPWLFHEILSYPHPLRKKPVEVTSLSSYKSRPTLTIEGRKFQSVELMIVCDSKGECWRFG